MTSAPVVRIATVAACAFGLAGCSDATGPGEFDPRFAVIRCATTISGTTVGNISVRSNQACTLEGVTVQGNVVVAEGGRLTLNGGRVDGNVQAERPSRLEVTGADVEGNLQVQQGSVVLVTETTVQGDIQVTEMSGPGDVVITLAGNLVLGGNIQVSDNRVSSLQVTTNTVATGNMQIVKNSGGGAKVVSGNTVAQNLQCKENTSPFTATLNVAGNREDQCAGS